MLPFFLLVCAKTDESPLIVFGVLTVGTYDLNSPFISNRALPPGRARAPSTGAARYVERSSRANYSPLRWFSQDGDGLLIQRVWGAVEGLLYVVISCLGEETFLVTLSADLVSV